MSESFEVGGAWVFVPDGGSGPTVRCPNGHEFDRDEARAMSFDGDTAVYQCPACGARTEGPPPS